MDTRYPLSCSAQGQWVAPRAGAGHLDQIKQVSPCARHPGLDKKPPLHVMAETFSGYFGPLLCHWRCASAGCLRGGGEEQGRRHSPGCEVVKNGCEGA